MKAIIIVSFLFLLSLNAQAQTSKVICNGMDGYTVVSTLKELNVQELIDIECDESFFGGDLCYQGNRKGVVNILKGISRANLILEGNYKIKNIRILKNSISYTMWDREIKESVSRESIKKCNI